MTFTELALGATNTQTGTVADFDRSSHSAVQVKQELMENLSTLERKELGNNAQGKTHGHKTHFSFHFWKNFMSPRRNKPVTKIAYRSLNIKLVVTINQSVKPLYFFLKKKINNIIKPRNLCSLLYILNCEN